MTEYDIIIAGGGHNGLVCGALLAKAGMTILVVERNEWLGGGVCTREVTLPGFKHDMYGSSHVWIHANAEFVKLLPDLEKYGLKYVYAKDHITGHPYHEGPGIMALSLLVALAMAGFLLSHGGGLPWVAVLLLGLCGVAVYGINSLLLTSLPLSFSGRGNVSAVAGFLDFASYLGGGISGIAVGALLDRQGWSAVFVYWLAATLIAFFSAALLSKQKAL